ncbi:hypothetical protein NMG60_11024668 [Bertholletia excelsa]
MNPNISNMEVMKGKSKKGLIVKTWKLCKKLQERGSKKRRVAPDGCFCVYVGPEKQRFVVKTEHANHPLFRMLLEEAESEYGYSSQGPLALPCNVDIFCKVLLEMDDSFGDKVMIQRCCSFPARTRSSFRLLTPSRLVAIDDFQPLSTIRSI